MAQRDGTAEAQGTAIRHRLPPSHLRFAISAGCESHHGLSGHGNATVDDYRALQRHIGIERNKVVGAAAYGTDNSCLLDALSAFGKQVRGIALVDTGVSDAELQRI